MTLQDIFFNKDGSAFDSDDEDNWSVVKPRAARKKGLSTYQKAVQSNMRRILRMPPIFEAPGHMVYAPMLKPAHKDVPVRVISTALSRKNTTGMLLELCVRWSMASCLRLGMQRLALLS